MKRSDCILLFVFVFLIEQGKAQLPEPAEQQIENLSSQTEQEIEDDALLQSLHYFLRHPIELNTADEDDLRQLKILSEIHIRQLLQYRKLLGSLVSIYELQAVPGWNLDLIRRLRPFITVASTVSAAENLRQRFRGGDATLLMRFSTLLERQKGFDKKNATHFLGDANRYLLRYRYQYKNLLQYGVTGDKDAGERFFRHGGKGFDFYSAHFFARKIKSIKALALGDFTVNMGQGLMQWQALAFNKGADVLNIKRQAPVLLPYTSAGEYNFHRGAGITVSKKNWEATAFISFTPLHANMGMDTTGEQKIFTSFLTSGYHRTETELSDRYTIDQLSAGSVFRYSNQGLSLSANAIRYQFSSPLQKRVEPYNLFAVSGRNWSNYSVDYSYSFRNFHLFGELAVDQNFNTGVINGLQLSVDPKVDVAVLNRIISKKFNALYGNAFTEGVFPVNEEGIYLGLVVRPFYGFTISAYADQYEFPWLRYRTDASANGSDYLLQVEFTPNKKTLVYGRYRSEAKAKNATDDGRALHQLIIQPKQNLRLHLQSQITDRWLIKARTELVEYDRGGKDQQAGYVVFAEAAYKGGFDFTANLRLQYFETDGYESRIYAYESDVLYGYSIPAFYDKGFRMYTNLRYDFDKKWSAWLRFSQTIYRNKNSIGTGLEEIQGNKKSEIKLQLRLLF